MNSEILFIFTAFVALFFMIAALYLWRAAVRAQTRATQLEIEQAGKVHLESEAERLRIQLQQEVEKRHESEKQAIQTQQRLLDMEQRMAEQRKESETRLAEQRKDVEEFKTAAKASIMEAGQKLSTKLLEDHTRETKQAREQQEILVQKTAKDLMNNFSQLTISVAKIQERTQESTKQMETVMRALSHPGGAGQMAEAGLENALKQLGLEPDRDFMLQYHVAGEEENFRPDAVIFLSQDMIVVIDSKASKFLMSLVEAEGTEAEAAELKQLLSSVHRHIDKLSQKAYTDAVSKALKEKGRKLGRKLLVMYMPSEAMIERLHKADSSIRDKCARCDIVLSGPASLAAILSLSRQQIAAARQDANQERIIAEVGQLIANFSGALGHLDGMGKAMQNAAERFKDFSKSVNSRILPKLNKLQDMGVQAGKSKPLPKAIPVYDVQRHDQLLILEAEDGEGGESGLQLPMRESA